jgi:hypothetical protein
MKILGVCIFKGLTNNKYNRAEKEHEKRPDAYP